jgi:predicted permease
MFGRLWRRREIDEDTRSEIESHLELLTERYRRMGMTREQARASARRQFGNVTWHREEIHVMNGVRWIDELSQDLRYALRQIRHRIGLSALAVATLAIGIGGTTAVFSLAHAALLTPLPYPEPGQLVRLYVQEPDNPASRAVTMPAARFTALRERFTSLAGLAGTRSDTKLTGLDFFKDGQAERLRVLRVTSDYFRVLESTGFRGRGFVPDDEAGTARVVLSDAFWRRRFNGEPSVIGTTVTLSGQPYEVAGIAAGGFEDPIAGEIDVWLPHNLRGSQDTALTTVVGRVRSGVDLGQAGVELAAIGPATQEPSTDDDFNALRTQVVAVPLHQDIVSTSRDFVYLLLAAVGLVLLVVCVNVANLALVRATGRVHEFAVRAALGSGRGRLAQQIVVESLVLAAIGAVAGLAIALLGARALQALGRDALPRAEAGVLNLDVLLFTAGVAMFTAVACAILPALRLSRIHPNLTLVQQSRSATHSRRQGRLRSAFAVAQVALTLSLLTSAGVLSVSFYQLMNVDLGFDGDRALTFEISLPQVRYSDPARRAAFQDELALQLTTIPGVRAAGATSRLPATGSFHPWPVSIETGPLAGTRLKDAGQSQHRTVTGDVFNALSMPLLAGRTFDARDDPGAPMRAVVSAGLARGAFPGMSFEQVVGQRIRVLVGGVREIIGVVGDVTLDVYGRPAAVVYTSHRQLAANRNWELTHVVSTDGSPTAALPAVRAVVAAVDPELVVHRAAPLADVIGRGTSRERFALILIGVFAVVSLTLAAIGLYGVLAYAVRQRTHEIGIRMALGATAAEVRSIIFRHAAVVLGVGLVFGLAGSLALGRSLSALLFQVSPWDLRVIAATTLMLTATAVVAAWLPARRAGTVEPQLAMQEVI